MTLTISHPWHYFFRDFFLGELEDKEFIDWSFFEDLLKPSGQERADLKKVDFFKLLFLKYTFINLHGKNVQNRSM